MKMKKVQVTPENKVTDNTGKVLHHVTLLDASGSMIGGKYDAAVNGINEGFIALKNDTSGVTQTYTMVEFSGGGWRDFREDIKFHSKLVDVSKVTWTPMGASGGTPLIRSITGVINTMLTLKKDGEPVLLDIFTDGGETESYNGWAPLATLIKKVESDNNFTITFRGTPHDVKIIKQKLSLKDSNVLAHDNTSHGIAETFTRTTQQKLRYTKSFASGASADSLSQNFYSRTDEDAERGK